ncbi:hypothetical protein M8R20_06985 [Pseudomonas sp. R2.Fl]|nr:hypothetical protein [Pseudomonas sp. R2.Fl]
MKILVIAAAFGLTATAAMADCAGHAPINAATEVDRTIVTASVQTERPQSQPADQQILPPADQARPDTTDTTVID